MYKAFCKDTLSFDYLFNFAHLNFRYRMLPYSTKITNIKEYN